MNKINYFFYQCTDVQNKTTPIQAQIKVIRDKSRYTRKNTPHTNTNITFNMVERNQFLNYQEINKIYKKKIKLLLPFWCTKNSHSKNSKIHLMNISLVRSANEEIHSKSNKLTFIFIILIQQ